MNRLIELIVAVLIAVAGIAVLVIAFVAWSLCIGH